MLPTPVGSGVRWTPTRRASGPPTPWFVASRRAGHAFAHFGFLIRNRFGCARFGSSCCRSCHWLKRQSHTLFSYSPTILVITTVCNLQPATLTPAQTANRKGLLSRSHFYYAQARRRRVEPSFAMHSPTVNAASNPYQFSERDSCRRV